MDQQSKYLSTREAAEALNVSLRTVQLWVESGALKAWKTAGGHRRILNESVNEFLQKRELAKAPDDKTELVMVMVDDDREILDSYSLSIELTDLPVKLITATNGYEGLLLIGKHHPDIIMTDLMMPTMDGYQMLNAINSDDDMNDSEIIIVTALNKKNIKLKKLDRLKINVLQKPINFSELEGLLRNKVKEIVRD